jgi:hypothetical protein
MISPERLAQAIIKFFRYVGLPSLLLLCLAVVVEVIRPEFDRANLLASGRLPGFLGNALVNTLPGVVAMVAIPLMASWYLDKLYDTGGLSKAYKYLLLSMFGQTSAKPWLLIKEGRIAGNEDSILARVGGPGLLVIYNDNAVIIEQSGRLKRVLRPGYERIEHFEHIWEIVDLRPQHWVYTVSALTRDSIPISCDADVTFKIDDRVDGIPIEPTDEMPYPFTEAAVLKAATATWIREEERDDQVMKWTGRVIISNTEGALRSILARHRLDELVQPGQPGGSNPTREEIRRQLKEKLEQSAPSVGAKILSVDIGKIDIKVDLPEGEEQVAEELSDEVLKQWIGTWQAELERVAMIQRAEGEAALASLEAVSVQAQAEMVLALTEAVQSLISAEEVSAYRLSLRFIEALRWMSFDPNVRAFMPLETLRSLQKLHETVEQASLPPGQAALPGGGSRQHVEEMK